MRDPVPVTATICTAAVLLGIVLSISECSRRSHDFRVACVQSGGTLIAEYGARADHCVRGSVTPSKP